MTTTINASTSTGLVNTADTSGIIKLQSNGTTTNALAWVNFNGVSGASARSSYNISSLTRSSTGIYVINFTTALSDANYCINMSISVGTTAAGGYTTMVNTSNTTIVTPTTSSCTVSINLVGVGAQDASYVMVSIFGN